MFSSLFEKEVLAPNVGAILGRAPTPARSSVGRPSNDGTASIVLPAHVEGLQWPVSFTEAPRGERLELSEEDGVPRRLATRSSGVGHGICFVGPLQADRGIAYFEIEVGELDKGSRSQTMAIGLCCSLPTTRLPDRAKDLGQGSYLIGYDLPKFFANGADVGKINTKDWRPLKELAQGDRVGVLVDRNSMELAVFVNGLQKVKVTAPVGNTQQRWPSELWGVVDVHGTVRSVRLRQPGQHARAEAASSVPVPSSTPSAFLPCDRTQRLASTQEMIAPSERTDTQPVKTLVVLAGDAVEPDTRLLRRGAEATTPLESSPRKRARFVNLSCNCAIHLICHNRSIVHIPGPEFVIGRNPKSCNLSLDSEHVPNMVSRKHAMIEMGEAVEVVDCGSLNGTWVNGEKVDRATLKHGDVVVIGIPKQVPPEFHFTVSMPQSHIEQGPKE